MNLTTYYTIKFLLRLQISSLQAFN